jgi:hypothetical protein
MENKIYHTIRTVLSEEGFKLGLFWELEKMATF